MKKYIYGVPRQYVYICKYLKWSTTNLIGQPGSFVCVSLPNGKLLSMIIDISMKETLPSQTEIKQSNLSEEYLLNTSKRIISVIPVGTINNEDVFEIGSDVLPTVNNDVYAVLPDLIDKVYASFAEGIFSLGKLSFNS